MLGRAVEKYIRMSPRKMRFMMDPIRRHTVAEALNVLALTSKRACKPLAKAIASAFANARQQDPTLVEDQVVISKLTADGGPMWKRHRAAAFGRATKILKRTVHVTVELDRRNGHAITAQPDAPAGREPQSPTQKAPRTKPRRAAQRGKTTGAKRPAARRTTTKKATA